MSHAHSDRHAPRVGRAATAALACLVAFGSPGLRADALPFQPPPIQVPPGYVVEVAAAPPLVSYPMQAGFDDRGRLLVCDSAGKNIDAAALLEQLPSFIRRLEDTDGDGRFDRGTLFADKLTFPSGVLWHEGAAYTASPPFLWRLEDTDGDGVADRRQALVGKFHFRGHAGDVHGPFLGPDGRLFWTDGILGHEIRDRGGRLLSQGKAARVFAARADGGTLETFCGGGMANPVAVAFTEEGEVLGVTTFYNPDKARHDALLHFVYGGVYPMRQEALLREFKQTGPPLPALLRWGMSAPSGLLCYRGRQLGADAECNVFISHFNTRSVTRVRLRRDGATFRAEEEPFLTSTSPDFHPCQVLEDADGSLLVIDTGGWVKIGCATTQVAKPDVRGAIYRVRRIGTRPPTDPWGLTTAWDTASPAFLIRLLDDERFAVRDRALATLAQRGESAVESLREALAHDSVRTRRQAVSALTRIGTTSARAVLRAALDDPEMSVRLAAAVGVATHRDAEALPRLIRLVGTDVPAVRRQAAAGLGRLGRAEAVPALLAALHEAGDRMLEHALIFALIEIHDRGATLRGLRDPSPGVQRAALVALDQMEAHALTRADVAGLAATDDRELQRAVLEVTRGRPSWAGEVTGLLRKWLAEPGLAGDREELLRETLIALGGEPAVQALIGEVLARAETPVAARLVLWEGIARGGRRLPAAWRPALVRDLASPDHRVARQAIAAIAAAGGGALDDVMRGLARDPARPVELRVAAAGVLGGRPTPLDPDLFELLVSQCNPDAAFGVRLEAARALGAARLEAEQLAALIPLVAWAGPLELPALLKAFETDPKAELGLRLIAALEQTPGRAVLAAGQLAKLTASYPADVRAAAERLQRRLAEEKAVQTRRFEGAWELLDGGDPARGRQLFFGQTAACAACHRARGQGEDLGPDLTRIGAVRSRSDLLESIVFPSASFARGYEPTAVATRSGRIYYGVIAREHADSLTLRTAQRETIRIARSDVEEMAPGKISLMPAGLDKILTPDDLRDLLAYLSSLKE
jgi:putative membrane-bound dehydrogenase-like protein